MTSKSDLKHREELAQNRGNSWWEGQRRETTAHLRNWMSVQSEEREWQEMNKVKAPACHGEEFGLDPDVLGSHLRLLRRCGFEERAGDEMD